jgi:SagB-type dehydrogenase family enzyme
MMNTRDAADVIHRSTKHGTPALQPLVNFPRLDPHNRPSRFKQYRGLSISPLSGELLTSTPSAVRVLSGGGGEPHPLDATLLATLLYLAAGVTRTAGSAPEKTFFRTAMSAGNLHPIEVYVIAGHDVEGIASGVYHFAPMEFGLAQLRQGDFLAALSVTTPVALVLTGLVWRTTWKYGERGWRHLYWDAGTMLANLLAVADAHRLGIRVFSGFADEAVASLVGVDGIDEVPLAVVALGAKSLDAEPDTVHTHVLPPLHPDVAPVAPRPIRLPMVVDAQEGGTLALAEVAPWQRAAVKVSSAVPTGVDEPGFEAGEPIEAVILRRGSTRLMRHDSVSSESLTWPMAAATRAVPLDAAPRGTLLEHYLNVHAVEGVKPGKYRWINGGVTSVGDVDSPRKEGATLCFGQPLGGDSAYTVFHSALLDPLLDNLGSRGYRAAQLEAGIVSGRLALSAFALGLGATGLTFFDDLVSVYFQTASASMLATAVGVSDTSPAPAGRPGQPATLGRYHELMARVSFQIQRSPA